jgi:hypothetical protein
LLLNRYGNIDYVMGLPLKRSAKLIKKAQEEIRKEAGYQWWLARYPLYTKDTYETFEEFYDKLHPQKVVYDMRSKDEIMQDILGIR